MTEEFYALAGRARENEWRADGEALFKIVDPAMCREVAEAADRLLDAKFETMATTIAQTVVPSAISTKVLLSLAEHAFWNFDNFVQTQGAWREYYFQKLERVTRELHKRRTAGDKALKKLDWTVENRYVFAAAMMNRFDAAFDMLDKIPAEQAAQRAVALVVFKLHGVYILGGLDDKQKEALFEKVMAWLDSEDIRNLVYTVYERTKKEKDEKNRFVVTTAAAWLLPWYERQKDYTEALRFLEDSQLGEGIRKHLEENIATSSLCAKAANATIGATVFASLCIGLYSFTIHAVTHTDPFKGADIFEWYSVPAAITGLVLFNAISDKSAGGFDRGWHLALLWWIFLFFALPLVSVAYSFLASIVFFFVAMKGYPRHRGWGS